MLCVCKQQIDTEQMWLAFMSQSRYRRSIFIFYFLPFFLTHYTCSHCFKLVFVLHVSWDTSNNRHSLHHFACPVTQFTWNLLKEIMEKQKRNVLRFPEEHIYLLNRPRSSVCCVSLIVTGRASETTTYIKIVLNNYQQSSVDTNEIAQPCNIQTGSHFFKRRRNITGDAA